MLDKYPEYEANIGIEVHVQLTTKSKMFCASANHVGSDPNTNICNICAGYPGSLPVVNRQAVDYAILAGLATHCTIAPVSTFDRKHYFYPDLPKDYQITQQFHPICLNGFISISQDDGTMKKIRLNRIHMEEDAGKNIHSELSNESFVDFNRAGTPLLEIVSEPDIENADQAKVYLKILRSIVQYLGICTGNMEDGAFRADINISIRKKGASQLGMRVELKNINSFKSISDAIEYEFARHIDILQKGGTIAQETRLWDAKNKKTISMRSKEKEADYRYFTDPDLPLIKVDQEWIDRIAETIPELPDEKYDRFIAKKGLSPYQATIIIEDSALAHYFDKATALSDSPQIIHWILRDLLGYLKEENKTLAECAVTPEKLVAIITMVETGKINNHAAKEVFLTVAKTGNDPEEIVKEKGLEQIGSMQELEEIVKEIIATHPDNVNDYRQTSDDQKSRKIGFFIGKAMKKTAGKGDPKVINQLVKKYLDE